MDAWEAYFRGYRAVMHHFDATEAFGELSGREYDVLLHLARGPADGMRQRDLLREVMFPQPSLSRMLARMEERGLLTLEAVEDDRRGRQVLLTTEGRETQRRVGRVHAAAIRRALDGFDDEELEVLRRFGARLARLDDPAPSLGAFDRFLGDGS